MSYVEIPASRLRAKLAEMGFEPVRSTSDHYSFEEIYERRHHRDPSYFVRVYSSISYGDSTVRECGKDAIRVVALRRLGSGKIEGIAKTKRIHRTGTIEGVLERVHERAREAYSVINRRLKERR